MQNKNSKTLAGRLVYPIANTFVVQWEDMLKLYPKAVYWGVDILIFVTLGTQDKEFKKIIRCSRKT